MSNVIACAVCTDADLAGNRMAAPGKCSWTIKSVKDSKSEAGNAMVKIMYLVIDSEGHAAAVFENLPMHVSWRVGRIASATGTSDMAKSGNIDIDKWVGKTGFGLIEHEQSDGYKPKAVMAKFLKDGESAPAPAAPAAPAAAPDFNDGINF